MGPGEENIPSYPRRLAVLRFHRINVGVIFNDNIKKDL
jgi:hypothetical protein